MSGYKSCTTGDECESQHYSLNACNEKNQKSIQFEDPLTILPIHHEPYPFTGCGLAIGILQQICPCAGTTTHSQHKIRIGAV